MLHAWRDITLQCRQIAREIGLEDLMLYRYSKKDIKEAVKAAMKKEFLEEMKSSVKVKDRLSLMIQRKTPISIECLYPELEYGSDIGQELLLVSKATLDILM